MDRLKSCLLKNGYPKIVVEGTIAGVIDKQGISKAPVIDVPKLKVFMKLPYIGPESLKLKKQILTLFRNTFNSAELSIVFKAGSTIGQMFPFKDRVPQLMRSFVIYKITCDACGASYIGKTTQLLNARLTRELSGRENSALIPLINIKLPFLALNDMTYPSKLKNPFSLPIWTLF